ncbi:hypothetical protein Holit_03073 [Hollandina sp. SP2]
MVFRHDLRVKAAFPILGNFDRHRPVVGSQFLGRFPVLAVCQCFFTLVMFLIPKMTGQFSFHGSLYQGLGKRFYDSLWSVKIVLVVVVFKDFIQRFFLRRSYSLLVVV